MKKALVNISVIVLLALSISSCGDKGGIPPLDETFSKKDKDPFGAYVMRNQLDQFYYHNSVKEIKSNFEATWRKINDTGAVYINISRNLFLTKDDLTAMLSYVYNGNSLFLSSENLDGSLLDTLGCSIGNSLNEGMPEMKNTRVSLVPSFYDSAAYQYFYYPFYKYFSKLPKDISIVLGNNNGGPDFIVVFYGRGRFYLHSDPRALSNYFLLQKDNYKYLRQLFAFTPSVPEHVYWDDFYNRKNFPSSENSKSSFAVLLQYPAMAWAFWLALLMMGLYIFFNGKRRQRIVEPLLPNTNTTLAFTETVGRLYLQKKDNRNIADKLITYFMEHIRNQYYLNTNQVNEEFIVTLARKTNSRQEVMDHLFNTIKDIQQSPVISDDQLLSLNQQIEHFYKNKV